MSIFYNRVQIKLKLKKNIKTKNEIHYNKKSLLQIKCRKKPLIKMKIISVKVIKNIKFDINKKILHCNETYILWVRRSGEGLVVIVFSIMGWT